jgi:hypothetical protein
VTGVDPPKDLTSWPDRSRPADIEVLDAATVGHVIALIQLSDTSAELAIRETELDALWSLAEVAARSREERPLAILELMWEAHEALGHGRLDEAVTALATVRGNLVEPR